jgi:N-acetylglucosamine-6-sulfatase
METGTTVLLLRGKRGKVLHTARRRRVRAWLSMAVALAAALFSAGCAAEAQETQSPNILFVLTDDQPAATVEEMPTVQAQLVAQGISFENAFVTDPLCCPSRATILTGRYAHNHGLWTNHKRQGGGELGFRRRGLDQDTIATRLSEAGYSTGLFGKYLNEYEDRYVPPGWGRWFAYAGGSAGGDYRVNSDGKIMTYSRENQGHPTDVVQKKAGAFIEGRAGKPWFAYVAVRDPHNPYAPPPRHVHDFDGVTLPRKPSFDTVDPSQPSYVRKRPRLSTEEEKDLRKAYQGKLETLQTVDDLVGGLLATLKKTGQLENTYVFFATDNGYLLGEHRLEEKSVPYEEAIRTPFFIRGPGVPAGQEKSQIVSNVDLAPTFADLATAEPPTNPDGRSLEPLLSGSPPQAWRDALLLESRVRNRPIWAGLRTERYAYIEYETGEKELYNLEADPYQLRSVHESADPTLVSDLSKKLDALRGCAGQSCREAENAP